MLPATSQIYQRNIDALRALQPDVAERVDVAAIPHGVEPATGRDGSRTFRLIADGGASEWFGRSSMPRVSASEALAGLAGDGRNAALPGILTGVEPLVALERMPRHCALFVVERNPVSIKLAMHLHDYSDLITSGRMVLLLEGDLVAGIGRLLDDHPGYEMPTQLIAVPQRSPAELADLRRLLQSAGESASRVYGRVMENCAADIRARAFAGCPARPRVALLCEASDPASCEQASRVQRALAKLQWPHRVCPPDDPRFRHGAARLRVIRDSSADLVLFINGPGKDVRGLLPPELPTVSWYMPGANVSMNDARKDGPNHSIIAASPDALEALVAAGCDPNVVMRCEPSADDTMFNAVDGSRGSASPKSVLMLMDLPDDRPEACGVTLSSHRTLLNAFKQVILADVDSYGEQSAPELVDRAQQESGVTLEDSRIREQFIELVRVRLIPAIVARAHARTIAESGWSLSVWGRNWSLDSQGSRARDAAVPMGRPLRDVFDSAGVLVLPRCDATSMQAALDALAAGLGVVCRAPERPFEELFPGQVELLPYFHLYRTRRELIDVVRESSASFAPNGAQADAARSVVLDRHCVSHRLLEIVGHVRARATVRAG